MIALDIYEPLSLYRDEFRDKFAIEAAKFFDGLVERSGVDIAANDLVVKKIRSLEESARAIKCKRGWFLFLLIFLVIGATVALFYAFHLSSIDESPFFAWWGFGISFILLCTLAIPQYTKASTAFKSLKDGIASLKAEGYRQLRPLNALYEWDCVQKLIEKTVPRLKFDPYFTEGRLFQLKENFGWDDSFNDGKSVLCAQSGEINGNPFVFGKLLSMAWGQKTYTGSRTVSWTEMEFDDGKLRSVRKWDTIHASVTKPFPEYSYEDFLIYGNDAAPRLTFTRQPSDLSDDDDGFFSKIALKSKIRELEKLSRNLDDDSGYTIMANREFEALFNAVDRNDEQEFRLLFTPLAQRQMLDLLRDKEVGYGDDFAFIKANKINMIFAKHLANANLDTNPSQFTDYSIGNARLRFLNFARAFFKDTYFALAPLLTIPLYQQTRTHEDIYGISNNGSSFWEHETIANFHGQNRFKHPESVTENILKTSVSERRGAIVDIDVTAYGYKSVPRIATIPVMARNGRYYDVDVEWEEFVPVSRLSSFSVGECEGLSRKDFDLIKAVPPDDWSDFFRNLGTLPEMTKFRRSIIST